MYLRRNNKLRLEVSFDEPLNIDWDGNELLLSDVLGTEGDIIYKFIEEEVDRRLLYAALQKLSGREKKIMELRFGLKGGRLEYRPVLLRSSIKQERRVCLQRYRQFQCSLALCV